MNLHRAGHTVAVTDDHGITEATCTCGWALDCEDRLVVVNAAWEHLRHRAVKAAPVDTST